MLAWLIVKGGKGGMKKCQEPKNDFLASMCPKWVPDTLSGSFARQSLMFPFPSPIIDVPFSLSNH
jgi:hypothetical protein